MAEDRDDDRDDTEPLWRDLLGRQLRRARRERGATLTEISRRAGISPQYLSEIERGVKEPSSEMIAAVAGALGLSLLDLTSAVTGELYVAAPAHGLRPVSTALALVA